MPDLIYIYYLGYSGVRGNGPTGCLEKPIYTLCSDAGQGEQDKSGKDDELEWENNPHKHRMKRLKRSWVKEGWRLYLDTTGEPIQRSTETMSAHTLHGTLEPAVEQIEECSDCSDTVS